MEVDDNCWIPGDTNQQLLGYKYSFFQLYEIRIEWTEYLPFFYICALQKLFVNEDVSIFLGGKIQLWFFFK